MHVDFFLRRKAPIEFSPLSHRNCSPSRYNAWPSSEKMIAARSKAALILLESTYADKVRHGPKLPPNPKKFCKHQRRFGLFCTQLLTRSGKVPGSVVSLQILLAERASPTIPFNDKSAVLSVNYTFAPASSESLHDDESATNCLPNNQTSEFVCCACS